MINSDQPEARYVNPMTDFGFKKVFGDEEVMTAFLTDLLKPASPITHITFLDKELQPANALERETYRRSLDAYRSNAATYAYERAEGRAEGIIETARNMKENGVALEIIQKCTGLTPEVIADL